MEVKNRRETLYVNRVPPILRTAVKLWSGTITPQSGTATIPATVKKDFTFLVFVASFEDVHFKTELFPVSQIKEDAELEPYEMSHVTLQNFGDLGDAMIQLIIDNYDGKTMYVTPADGTTNDVKVIEIYGL